MPKEAVAEIDMLPPYSATEDKREQVKSKETYSSSMDRLKMKEKEAYNNNKDSKPEDSQQDDLPKTRAAQNLMIGIYDIKNLS
jgi:hypothetical protein